jgi:hypothetical protein
MASMPQETRDKISEAVKRAGLSPTVRQRRKDGQKGRWTAAARAALGKERREYWRQWREAKAATKEAQPNATEG